ncbi:enoyl-CoA hydratase-related protein [Tistrella mobilis]|uniref:Enoyl-CoA hydratase n=1 Tax=Tistrella mobilis (strain KA081020-065) TaxID=1110502 RepID=I3THT4_TISMK|nr:enoyl-CoA hydratase-related protein [Tistrella mobilis]AFK52322.1 enoyl-CoA hydratase [Tistrella mobilis KA081020-065]
MSELLERIENGVAWLTLNRPERRNAMSRPMLAALVSALTRLAADDEVRVVVLTGAGGAFCAGGDVKRMAETAEAEAAKSSERRATELRQVMEASRWLHEMGKPTIAALPGPAAGAGLSLALACDMRIAARTAVMTTAFAKVALSGDFGGSWFLTQLVGPAKARELYLTAELLDMAAAEKLGLVNRVVDAEALEAQTRMTAETLARGPALTYAAIKRNMNLAQTGTLSEVMDLEAIQHTRCSESADHREAAQAFVEKRAPRFIGR